MNDRIYPCGLCNKAIQPNEARVNFGRKSYHGKCFVEHCKKHHNPPSDEEGDVNDWRKK